MKLYHFTQQSNFDSISENGGLLIEKSKDGFIYLTSDINTAICFAILNGVKDFLILELSLNKKTYKIQKSTDHNEKALKEMFGEHFSGDCYYSPVDIPFECITDITEYHNK